VKLERLAAICGRVKLRSDIKGLMNQNAGADCSNSVNMSSLTGLGRSSATAMPGSKGVPVPDQVICWDRGRPARSEGEARKRIVPLRKKLRARGAFAGGTPAVPANHLNGLQIRSES